MRRYPGIFLFLLLLFAAAPATAHYPWITVLSEDPLCFELGWGHEFPSDGIMAAERLASLTLTGPDGQNRQLPVQAASPREAATPAATGTSILAAEQLPAFYSRTPQGGRAGSKAEHPDAVSCSQSANTMKALVSRSQGGGAGRILGHTLEIVPLSDAAALRKGEELAVRILFRGEPFRGTVEATWAGFAPKDAYAVTTESDQQGVARIPLSQNGLWLVKASAREPYADPAVCDHRSFTATLTFQVR